MSILHIVFSVSVYTVACLGMGGIIMRVLSSRNDNISLLAGIASRFLLGQGLLANLWVFIALPGLFSPTLVWGIIGALFIVGVLLHYGVLTPTAEQALQIWREIKSEPWGWKLTILAAVIAWLSWVPFWFPLQTSGSRFYMALPKVISASEQLKVLPGYENVASLGLQGEMQFAALMTMGNPEATQTFTWLTLTAGCILLLAFGRKVGLRQRGQWLALAMIFTSSAVISLSGSGKTDIYSAAFAFATYYWAFKIEEGNKTQTSILTGLFGGLAVTAKISYAGSFLPSLAVLLLWKIFFQNKDQPLKSKILSFALIGLSAAFVAVQLPVKNQILFNNPLAPFGMEDIANQMWYGAETIRKIYTALPFSLIFGGFWGQGGNLSPLALMFLPLIFFLHKPRRLVESPLSIVSFAAVLGLAFWFMTHPTNFAPRYFLACLLILVLPVSKAAEAFSSVKKNTPWIQVSVILLVLYTSISYISYPFGNGGNLRQILSGEANCEIETMRCLIETNVNATLEPGTRIFTNTRHRYWLRPDLIQCEATTEEMETYLALETPELRWGYLVGRGFENIMIENRNTALPNMLRNDLNEIPDWLSVTYAGDNKQLFYLHLNPKNDARPILYDCSQLSPPAWSIAEISNP